MSITPRRSLLPLPALLAVSCAPPPGGPLFGYPVYGVHSLIGLVILVLDLVAIVRIAQSGASLLAKVIWIVVILAMPVVGLLLWLLLGPGRKA